MRFRAEQHLRRAAEIRTVREQGRRIECQAFTVWWKTRASVTTTTSEPLPARVCVIASTKAVGGAIQRNRAKRRLREVFRSGQRSVPAGCDLLLIARVAATTWPIAELEKKFAEACARIAPPPPPELASAS
jgi:ribonuclease P protein component